MARHTITIAAAIILSPNNEMLLVRKRGTTVFMQPGGKVDAGETPSEALLRELKEEVSLEQEASDISFVGTFSERAAFEPDADVFAHTFVLHNESDVSPNAEIEETRWLPLTGEPDLELAALTRNHMLPQARKLMDLSA